MATIDSDSSQSPHRPAGLCPHCEYPTDPGTCAECGKVNKLDELLHTPYTYSQRLARRLGSHDGRLRPQLRAILLVLLTITIVQTAVRVEIWNARAGNPLSREVQLDLEGLTLWGYTVCTDESSWRRHLGPRDSDGTPVSRELTSREYERMQREVELLRANNRLRNLAGSWSLLQYPLAPFAVLFAIATLLDPPRRRRGVLGIVCLFLAAAVICQMAYRGYFTRFGW